MSGRSAVIDKFSPDPAGLPEVVSFSGGRTSGMMLRMLLDQGKRPLVLFANTGKERDETLDFVHEVETRWAVPVVWLEYRRVATDESFVVHLKTERMREYARRADMMHWFERVSYGTAARHGDAHGPFDDLLGWLGSLPNPTSRSCTAQLKIRTMCRYLWSQGVYRFISHVGYRSDELSRAIDIVHSKDRDADVGFRFILAENGVTKPDVREFWRQQPFDLKLEDYEGNCHLCFLKRLGVKRRLAKEQAELTQWWVNQELLKRPLTHSPSGARWRDEKGHSAVAIVQDSNARGLPFDDDGPAMECSCTAGGGLGVYDGYC